MLLTVALTIAAASAAYAQERPAEDIYEAYVAGDMGCWGETIAAMEAASLDAAGLRELAEYYYGYAGYLTGSGDRKAADDCIRRADRLADRLLEEHGSDAAVLAFKGIFAAYGMALHKVKTPVLGPRCLKYIEAAYRADSCDVYALAAMGNMRFYSPAVFGGDKEEGIRHVARAVERYEATGRTSRDWHYLYLLTTLARFMEETGRYGEAVRVYEKALAVEPRLTWVRDELLPPLRTKAAVAKR